MMTSCLKKSFHSMAAANSRAREINTANINVVPKPKRLRAYKCEDCNKWHLTSMTKQEHKFISDPKYRTKIREQLFIKLETEHWEKHFNIDN